MKTATIYKVTCAKGYSMAEQGTAYSFEPWGKNTEHYEGHDDGGAAYCLPEGYRVAPSEGGRLMAYDAQDRAADLVCFAGGPALVTSSPDPIRLRRA